ncbi:MAG: enoyl-CoA hydratase/isomerase family protein [Deltaproteobacteria bacterium]|nr:enoyl-CoA hydratase/isomerase family protein [Deltaproteobacteria bacterium]
MGELLYEVREGAARLTLNREAQRNALSAELLGLLEEALDRAEADAEVRAVCLTGAGDKAFCSGADLGSGPDGALLGARRYAGLLRRLRRYPKPLVARLNGHCLAGGMGLMLACDIVYARDGIKLGTPEARVGLFPLMIGALIHRNARRKRALEMMLTAEPVTAREAEAMGLVTRVYPGAAELDAAVDKTLAAIRLNAPLALSVGRRAMVEAEELGFDEAVEHLCGKLHELLGTEDAAEGLSAFVEKRPPRWTGR